METPSSPEQINKPEITVEKDQITGMDVFVRDLFERGSKTQRGSIVKYHPKLQELERSGELTPEKVREYLEEVYKSEAEKIDGVVEESRKILEAKGEEGLALLAKYMDYDWRPEDKYKAIPTLLPYSPFNKHTFYYSMYGQIFGDWKNDILHISIHEISHFMLFQLLDDLKMTQFDQQENSGLLYMFKESLTGMLLSEPELSQLLEKREYKGNPDTHHIFIQEAGGEPRVFQEFLREKFKRNKEVGGNFSSFLIEMVNLLLPHASEFAERKKMWNEQGKKIEEDPELLKIYSQPIKF